MLDAVGDINRNIRNVNHEVLLVWERCLEIE